MLKGFKLKGIKLTPPLLALFLIVFGVAGYALTTLWSGTAVEVTGVAKPKPVAAVSTLAVDLGNVTAGDTVTANGTLTVNVSPSTLSTTVRLQLEQVQGISDYEIRFYRGGSLVGIIDPTATSIVISQQGSATYDVVMSLTIANVSEDTPIQLTITGTVEG